MVAAARNGRAVVVVDRSRTEAFVYEVQPDGQCVGKVKIGRGIVGDGEEIFDVGFSSDGGPDVVLGVSSKGGDKKDGRGVRVSYL